MRTDLLKLALLVGIVIVVLVLGTYAARMLPGVLPLLSPTEPPQETESAHESFDRTSGLPFSIPPEFTLHIFAEDLPGVRDIVLDPVGNLVVSLPGEGRVVALFDTDADGRADDTHTVISGLNRPHGLATLCVPDDLGLEQLCHFYIAEEGGVSRYRYDAVRTEAFDKEELMQLPQGGGHNTRSLLVVEGGQPELWVSTGSSCNVCVESEPLRSTIARVPLYGGEPEIVAEGLRNAVFMEQRPRDSRVWVTEMGRDNLGDDTPPDELNIIDPGAHYGWPYCYGDRVRDTTFGGQFDCTVTRPAHVEIQAHSAPLGLHFLGAEFGAYAGDLLVAYHGSWNRTVPTGYKIERFTVDADGTVRSREPFMSGWLTADGEVIGRPVDILSHDGALYITDDRAGRVYRLNYTP